LATPDAFEVTTLVTAGKCVQWRMARCIQCQLSAETALARGSRSGIAGLSLSAVFDTADQHILLHRLETSYRLGLVSGLFKNIQTEHRQYTLRCSTESPVTRAIGTVLLVHLFIVHICMTILNKTMYISNRQKFCCINKEQPDRIQLRPILTAHYTRW